MCFDNPTHQGNAFYVKILLRLLSKQCFCMNFYSHDGEYNYKKDNGIEKENSRSNVRSNLARFRAMVVKINLIQQCVHYS